MRSFTIIKLTNQKLGWGCLFWPSASCHPLLRAAYKFLVMASLIVKWGQFVERTLHIKDNSMQCYGAGVKIIWVLEPEPKLSLKKYSLQSVWRMLEWVQTSRLHWDIFLMVLMLYYSFRSRGRNYRQRLSRSRVSEPKINNFGSATWIHCISIIRHLLYSYSRLVAFARGTVSLISLRRRNNFSPRVYISLSWILSAWRPSRRLATACGWWTFTARRPWWPSSSTPW